MTVVPNGRQREVGSSQNTIDMTYNNNIGWEIRRIEDNWDVTSYFTNIYKNFGTLMVNQGSIFGLEIESRSAAKEYDGTALTSTAPIIRNLPGPGLYRVEIDITGSQTDVGDSPNTIDEGSLAIYRVSDDAIVTDSFINVKYITGTLSVTTNMKDKITIITDGATKPWDGDPLTNAGYRATGLPANHFLTAETNGSQTYIGSSYNTLKPNFYGAMEYKIVRRSGTDEVDVTGYFGNVAKELGTLEVTGDWAVKVITEGGTKEYNGTALKNPAYRVVNLLGPATRLKRLPTAARQQWAARTTR
jgi:hypothetical protein